MRLGRLLIDFCHNRWNTKQVKLISLSFESLRCKPPSYGWQFAINLRGYHSYEVTFYVAKCRWRGDWA
jgi:hypothetical protein